MEPLHNAAMAPSYCFKRGPRLLLSSHKALCH